ncbi:hypothetical protein BVX98_04685 [bacterium F11]|nr:hypothetical protein BVX98_04685 [bacterium F11]
MFTNDLISRLPARTVEKTLRSLCELSKKKEKNTNTYLPQTTLGLSNGAQIKGWLIDAVFETSKGPSVVLSLDDGSGKPKDTLVYIDMASISMVAVHNVGESLVHFSEGIIDPIDLAVAPASLVLKRSLEDISPLLSEMIGKKVTLSVEANSFQWELDRERAIVAEAIAVIKETLSNTMVDNFSKKAVGDKIETIKLENKPNKGVSLEGKILSIAISTKGNQSARFTTPELQIELNKLL